LLVGFSILATLTVPGCTGAPRREATPPAIPSSAATSPRVIQSAPAPATSVPDPSVAARVPATPRPAAPVSDEATPRALRGVPAPVWHVGDQWAFRWESHQGQGEYVWTVDRVDVLDGVKQYVIKAGPREIYYRAGDLATTVETNAGAVEVRHVPPRLAFSWPLAPGAMWRQSLTEETGPGPQRLQRTIAWQVESEERIGVEAGTFDTLKIVAWHEHYKSEAVMYEMWYAPAVKQWVRLKEHFPAGVRYRELTEFVLN
jgi:hypothetical protein